jgi:hypothetical protein
VRRGFFHKEVAENHGYDAQNNVEPGSHRIAKISKQRKKNLVQEGNSLLVGKFSKIAGGFQHGKISVKVVVGGSSGVQLVAAGVVRQFGNPNQTDYRVEQTADSEEKVAGSPLPVPNLLKKTVQRNYEEDDSQAQQQIHPDVVFYQTDGYIIVDGGIIGITQTVIGQEKTNQQNKQQQNAYADASEIFKDS